MENILHIHKGHFQVDLGEFRLTVSTEILVTEAACDLDIAVHARNHQQLLVDLRRLGQGIEFAVMHTGRDQIVSRTFRCGLHHHRRFDLDEVVGIEVLSGSQCNLVAHNQIVLQRRTAQIQIAVFQTQFLVGLGLVGDCERRCLCLGQYTQIVNQNLKSAGFHFLVDAGTLCDYALCHQHIFAVAGCSLFENGTVCLVVECQLYNAGAVTEINENQIAQVSYLLYKAADNDSFSCFCHFTAVTGAAQILHQIHVY